MLTPVWVLLYRVYIHYQNLLIDLYDLTRADLTDLVHESAEAWDQPRLTLDSLRADYEAFKRRDEDINDSPMLVSNRPSAPTSSEVPMKDFDNDLDKLALEPDTTGHNNIISPLLRR